MQMKELNVSISQLAETLTATADNGEHLCKSCKQWWITKC